MTQDKPFIIAISGKQFSGKDVVADYLCQQWPTYHKHPLARAIKEEFAALYHLTPQDIEANKSQFRLGLITLGNRRRQQNPHYWIDRVLSIPGPKVISDMRLQTEYAVLRRHGAYCVRVEAPRDVRLTRGTLVQEQDLTECDLDTIDEWDAVWHNETDVTQLYKQLDRWLLTWE